MAEYRNCECFACYRLVPKPEAHRLSIERETGRSGGSVRFNKNSTSYSTGRSYYRKQDVWLCSDCYQQYQEAQKKRATRSTIVGGAIAAGILMLILGNVGRSTTEGSSKTVQTSWSEQTPSTANFVRPVEAPKPSSKVEQDVFQIQTRLVELGYLAVSPNGTWGPKTRAAIRTFKVANGLSADENWDDDTSKRLFSKSAARAPAPIADAAQRK